MVFKSYQKIVILLLAITIGLFFFSSTTLANDFVLADGHALLLRDAQDNRVDVDFYTLQFTIATNTDNAYHTGSVIRINDLFFFEDGLSPGKTEEFYNYYADMTDVLPVQQKLILLTDQNNQKWELLLFFNEDGSTDYLRTSLAKVPAQYLDGYPVNEKVMKPAPSVTKENMEKKESYKTIEEDVISYRTNVCYLTDETPFVPSNHCEYFEAAQFGTIDAVSSDFVVPIKELLAKYDGSEEGVIDESKPTPAAGVTVVPTKAPEAVDELSPVVDRNPTEEVSSGKVVPQDYAERIMISPLSPKSLPLFYPDFLYASFAGPDVDLLYEDFDGAWPGPWTAWDANPSSGDDYWGDNSSQSYAGGWSGWAADEGTQTLKIFDPYESFEALLLDGWNYADVEPLNGSDTWGHSFSKKTAGLGSAYAAGNSSTGWNSKYDDNMKSLLYSGYYYDASQWESATLTYKVWYDTEQDLDWVTPIFSSDGGSNFTYQNSWKKTGASGGWLPFTVSVPSSYLTSQFTLGFYFFSNGTNTKEGAYIDEVTLNYVKKNMYIEKYDNSQDAYLKSGLINLSSVVNPELEYRLRPGMDGTDYFVAQLSTNGTSWQDLYTSVSTSTSWSQKVSDLSTYANQSVYIRFLFHSNSTGNSSAGPYIDNVRVHGDDKLSNGSVCTYSGECETNNCSSAPTKYDLTCIPDGSTQVKVTKKEYPQVCGGIEINPTTTVTNPSCASGYICDIDFSQNNQSTSSTSQICKKSLYQSCSSSSECWNDNGSGISNVDCKGSPSICTTGNLGAQCSNASQCDSGLVCTNGLCSDGAGVGDACAKDSDCQSKICAYNTSGNLECVSEPGYNPYVKANDNYDAGVSNSYSSWFDGVAFTGYSVTPVAYDDEYGLRQSADYICYDFNADGTYDACYYDTDVSSTVCDGKLSFPSSVSIKQQCDIDDPFGCEIGLDVLPARICSGAGCVVNTNTIKSSEVRAKVFHDCDNSEQLLSAQVLADQPYDDYYIVNPKFLYCDNQLSPGSGYYARGKFGSDVSDVAEYSTLQACPSNQSCSIAADEQYVSTATGAIPSACKTKPTHSCTQNSDCLYNSCIGNVCQNGFIYESFIFDALDNPLSNYTVKLTSCSSGSTLQSTTTDTDGKFTFVAPNGSYGMKLVAPWGDLDFDLGPGYCKTFSTGFHGSLEAWLYEKKTVVHGKAINPQGQPTISLPLELSTCQDSTLVSTTTNTSGDFLLTTDSGKQKIKATISGNKVPLSDESGNTCFLNYGDVDLGTMEITPTCNLYDNTCQDPNTRVFGCVPDPSKGCVCQVQYCEAGCTEGASICNPLGTGTLKVSVTNANSPVKNVSIKVDGSTQGKTNSLGKLEVNAKHGSHSVVATCPSGSPSNTKTVYLNADYQFVNISLNCPASSQKGDILIRAENVNGYPIANVLVAENDEKIGLTDSFGQLYLEDFDYGSHTISLIYRVTNEEHAGTYQKIVLVDLNQSVVTQETTILLPGDIGYSQFGATSYTGKLFFLAPAAVVIIAPIAFATLDVVSMAWSASDLCQCILGETYNLSQLGQCVGDFANPTCSDIRQCEGGLEKYAKEISQGQCWTESAMLAGDVASPFIPLGLVGHVGAFFISKIDDFKLIDKLGVAGKIVAKGEDFIEIIAENGAKIRAEIDDLAAQTILKGPNVGLSLKALGPDGIVGASHVSTKLDSLGVDSVKISKGLTSVFSEQSMIGVYQTIGKADGKVNVKWVEEFSSKVKTFNPNSPDGQSAKNVSGLLREILVAKAENIIDGLKVAAYKVTLNGVDIEYDLIESTVLREVKSPNSYIEGSIQLSKYEVLNKINGQVKRFKDGKPLLPDGVTFDQITFNIAKKEYENIPSEVQWALDKAVEQGTINSWKVVNI